MKYRYIIFIHEWDCVGTNDRAVASSYLEHDEYNVVIDCETGEHLMFGSVDAITEANPDPDKGSMTNEAR